ncbi:MAG: hypothetical protein ACI9GM_000807, partial [Salibacteraceae bacterium]
KIRIKKINISLNSKSHSIAPVQYIGFYNT